MLMSNQAKHRIYTFALTRDNDRVRKIVEKFPKFAYIKHDKDDTEEHYHYYVEFPNPRSISGVAKTLMIPDHMIEIVYSKKNMLQYLTHENDPQKFHYDKSDIVANFDITEETKSEYLTREEMEQIAGWFADYDEGKITLRELYSLILPLIPPIRITQYVSMLSRMLKTRNVGLSTFRVPCSSTPVSGTKKGGKMK